MNSQVDIKGILQATEKSDEKKPVEDTPKTNQPITQVFSGVLPHTNQSTNYYIFGLGVVLCLIAWVVYRLKNLSKKVK